MSSRTESPALPQRLGRIDLFTLLVATRERATTASRAAIGFADGSTLAARTVVWATGFRHDHALVHAPVFGADGSVEHVRGVTAVPGLYFLGLPWQHSRGSALLGWVQHDALHLAEHIDRFARERPEVPAVA